ncbi:aminopeptidase Ey-like [Haliotis rufescens]|uniref:aminopeptidase Ey-like n=1 Tax=Haliotis rufescens TaxID=6454 RepID=UPI00201EFA84|nr:aminopeptidase Ey-like [Haliotis rufescens]
MEGQTGPPSKERTRGFYLSVPCACALILLAVILAAVVGIVVFIVGPRHAVCQCHMPNTSLPVGGIRSREELHGFPISSKDYLTNSTMISTLALSASSPHTSSTSTSSSATSSTTTTTTQPPPVNKTFPGQVEPYHYNMELFIDIYQCNSSLFKLHGNVSIFLDVKTPTANIILHAKELTIFRQSLSLKPLRTNQCAPGIVEAVYDKEKELYTLVLDEKLTVGERYELAIRYEDKLTSSPFGISFGYDTDETGQKQYFAVSQFHPSSARQAIPCFDEPRYKTTFNITLVRKVGNYTSRSNTDIIRQDPRGDNFVADVYKTTPKMYIDILAFAVVNYDYMENVTSTGVTYRTISKPGTTAEATMAHEQGIRIFEWLNKNLQPPYPLSKIDNIVIKGRVWAGMENWGLLIYNDILFNPAVDPRKLKQQTMLLLAHEMCHQWLGNLVSPKTWRWAWLSEGFAMFFEVQVIHTLHPSRRTDELFVVDFLHRVFIDDANRHWPLVKDEPKFDNILYSKGAGVVRMMRLIFGEELFLRAINLYLIRHQYGSVENSDMWTVFNEEAAKENITLNVGDLMEPWLLQMHYPVVMVTIQRPGALEVSQQLFQTNMSADVSDDGAKYGYKWDIPLTYVTGSDTSPFSKEYTFQEISWLYRTQNSTLVEDVNITDPSTPGGWVLVNLHQTGYYRVNYEEANWLALVRQLETDHTVIPPVNRAQIIDDAFNLARVGLLNASIAFRTLGFLRNDSDYISWTPATRVLDDLDSRLLDTRFYGAFKAFVLDLITNAYRNYGLEGNASDTLLVVYQRDRIARLACQYGLGSCLADSSRLFNLWTIDQDKYRPSPDIVNVINCYGVREGGLKAWQAMYDAYSTTNDLKYAFRLLYPLACPKEPWLLRRVLDIASDAKKMKKTSHQSTVFTNLARSQDAMHVVWNYVKENINTLSEVTVKDVIRVAAQTLTSTTFASELELLANNTKSISPSVVSSALSGFNTRKLWLEDHSAMLTEWFNEMGYGYYIL